MADRAAVHADNDTSRSYEADARLGEGAVADDEIKLRSTMYSVRELDSMHGKTIAIHGAVTSAEDLTIEGRIIGPVRCEGRTVVVAATADVTGDILARDITVFGRAAGQLIATDVVDVRAGATL